MVRAALQRTPSTRPRCPRAARPCALWSRSSRPPAPDPAAAVVLPTLRQRATESSPQRGP